MPFSIWRMLLPKRCATALPLITTPHVATCRCGKLYCISRTPSVSVQLSDIEDKLKVLDEERSELQQYTELDRRRRCLQYTLYDKELAKAAADMEKVRHGGAAVQHTSCSEVDHARRSLYTWRRGSCSNVLFPSTSPSRVVVRNLSSPMFPYHLCPCPRPLSPARPYCCSVTPPRVVVCCCVPLIMREVAAP